MTDNGSRGETDEYTITDRVSIVVWDIGVLGATPTTKEIADRFGMTTSGAWRMMNRIARKLPLSLFDGQWMPSVMAEVLYCDSDD